MHHIVIDARAVETVGKEATHQELKREIINALDVLVVVDGGRGDHSFNDYALNCLGRRQRPIALRGACGVAGQSEFETV